MTKKAKFKNSHKKSEQKHENFSNVIFLCHCFYKQTNYISTLYFENS